MTFKTNLLPNEDNKFDLGSSSLGWKITKINIPTTSAQVSSSTEYGPGSSGQVLKSNGTTVYWGDIGNAKIFYGTCSTAAATTAKTVTCADFTSADLVKGVIIYVTFNNTNSGAVGSLTMSVNGTTAKPIKHLRNGSLNNIPSAGYLLTNQTYLFTYDGTNWVTDLEYNSDSNTLQRTFRSSTNVELPIAAISTANSSTAAYSAISSGGSKDVYAAIPNTDANRVMFNPSTGLMTFGQNGLKTSKIQAPTAAGGTTYGAGTSGQTLMTNGTTVYWGVPDLSSTYVKKSGDTMTGALIFNSSGNTIYPYIKRTDIDSSVTSLSSAKYGMVTGIKDKNDSWIGWIETVISTSGENQIQLAARKPVNGSDINNALALKIAANGTKTAVFESDVLPKTDNALNLGSSSNRWKNMYAANFTGSFTGNLTGTATSFGKGSHTAAVTANEFALTTGTATVVGNVSSTTMPRVSNANAEMIIKAHPTSGENYHEARLGFSSDTNLYYMPVNGTSWKKLVYEDKMYEANLQWGGKNFSASYGCIDAAMIGELGANRFAFLHPNGVTTEYSTNGGSTWIDYGQTGTGKTAIFSVGNGMYLGKHTTTGSSTVNDQLRITIDTSLAGIYTVLNKIALYISTNGADNVKVKIEKATHAAQTTFVTHLDWTKITGYPGWNILNIDSFTTYGNTDSQYQKIRFTFKQETAGTNKAASISKIYAFGGMGWITPSNMAANGHLYSYDRDQIAFFPNTVWANQSLAVRARNKDDTALSQGSFESYNKTGRVVGQIIYQHSSNSSNYDIVNTGQWTFRQYSPKSTPENATTGYAEIYKLPVVDSNITGSSKSYDILTTKLHFTNKTVATSAWAASTTYSGFSWKADITCNGVSANHVPNVIFDYNELISGNFCPFADSSSNKVTIYCKTKPTATITIPTIYCT